MAEAALADHGTNKGAKNKNAPHPTYMVMVKEAIQALKERNGSSRQKITKYIISNHLDTPDLTKVNHHVTNAIKKAVAEETIIQTKGIGANGSFKLAKSEKQVMAKKTTSAPKEKAPAKAKRVAKAKMPAPVVGKTPSKITKKAAVAKKRLSSVGAISAVLQTPRPKARKPKPPVHSPSPVSHIAPNETYTLSLSEESSQDDLPSLEIDEPPKKSKKPAVRKKATPTKKTQAKSKAKTSPKKTTAAKKTTAKKSEPAKGKTTAPATKKGAAAKSDTTAATTKAPAKKAPAKKAGAKKK